MEITEEEVNYAKEIFPGIDAHPEKLGGVPCIKKTRIPVWMILERLELRKSIPEIVESFEGIYDEDVIACIKYAKDVIEKRRIVHIEPSS